LTNFLEALTHVKVQWNNKHYVVVNIYIFVTNILDYVIPTIPTQNFKPAIDRNLLMEHFLRIKYVCYYLSIHTS